MHAPCTWLAIYYSGVQIRIISLAVVIVVLSGTWLRAAAPSAADADFFEKKIRPLLVERCHKCHSTTADKVKGGLLLDSRAAMLKGGDTGAAIVPGDADASQIGRAHV